MSYPSGEKSENLRWYAWPVMAVCLLAFSPLLLIVGLLSLISIPVYAIFPEHVPHPYDPEGPFDLTSDQVEFLRVRRARFSRLGIWQRFRRANRLWRHRRGIYR